MICSHCGAALDDCSTTCPSCGAVLDAAPAEAVSGPAESAILSTAPDAVPCPDETPVLNAAPEAAACPAQAAAAPAAKPAYDGKSAPVWMNVWRFVCYLNIIASLMTFSSSGVLSFQTVPKYLLPLLAFAALVLSLSLSLIRKKAFRYCYCAYLVLGFITSSTVNGPMMAAFSCLLGAAFTVYLFRSKKVALYLSYRNHPARYGSR